MTIHIDSLQSAMVFILSSIAVVTIAATLHWKLFAIPLLKKMMDPMGLAIMVNTRVLREKFHEEVTRAERDVRQDLQLRSNS